MLWVSPIVVAPKPKKQDECVDMRLPVQAGKREKHITPTIDDIVSEMSGSKIFSKLHLNVNVNVHRGALLLVPQ